MKIKIYQINMDRDNGSYSFTNYENTISVQSLTGYLKNTISEEFLK